MEDNKFNDSNTNSIPIQFNLLKSIFPDLKFYQSGCKIPPESICIPPCCMELHMYPISQSAENSYVSITVKASVPEEYPNISPTVEFYKSQGLTEDCLFDIERKVKNVICNHIGDSSMLYFIFQCVQGELSTINVPNHDCTMCLSSFHSGDHIVKTEACSHVFHKFCFQRYLRFIIDNFKLQDDMINSFQTKQPVYQCPICRLPLDLSFCEDILKCTSLIEPIAWSHEDAFSVSAVQSICNQWLDGLEERKKIFEGQRLKGGIILSGEIDSKWLRIDENTRFSLECNTSERVSSEDAATIDLFNDQQCHQNEFDLKLQKNTELQSTSDDNNNHKFDNNINSKCFRSRGRRRRRIPGRGSSVSFAEKQRHSVENAKEDNNECYLEKNEDKSEALTNNCPSSVNVGITMTDNQRATECSFVNCENLYSDNTSIAFRPYSLGRGKRNTVDNDAFTLPDYNISHHRARGCGRAKRNELMRNVIVLPELRDVDDECDKTMANMTIKDDSQQCNSNQQSVDNHTPPYQTHSAFVESSSVTDVRNSSQSRHSDSDPRYPHIYTHAHREFGRSKAFKDGRKAEYVDLSSHAIRNQPPSGFRRPYRGRVFRSTKSSTVNR